MFAQSITIDQYKIRCKFDNRLLLELFIDFQKKFKFDHEWHIKLNDIPLKVFNETYDGSYIWLQYMREDDIKEPINVGDIISLDIEIWGGKDSFFGKRNLKANDIMFVHESWEVIKSNKSAICQVREEYTDDIIELLKPKFGFDMFQKKLQTETDSEPSVIDVEFVEVNENQIEMKEGK